jgi:hypothetical protein
MDGILLIFYGTPAVVVVPLVQRCWNLTPQYMSLIMRMKKAGTPVQSVLPYGINK